MNTSSANLRVVQAGLTSLPFGDLTEQYGILVEDLELVTSHRVFTNINHRRRIRQTLESIMYGGLDAVGLSRFELPAEYIASWICVLVQPHNQMAACGFFDRARQVDQLRLSPEDSQTYESISPQRLFALCVEIGSADPDITETLRRDIAGTLTRLANITGNEIIDKEDNNNA